MRMVNGSGTPVAVLHTPKPSNRGELEFLARLQDLLDDDAHIWAELNSHTLGFGAECDFLLVAPNLGAFAIELKSILLDQIESMGPKECSIRYPGGVQNKHPLDQARGGMNSVRNHLQKHAHGDVRHPYPFMQPIVAFPKITFEDFAEAFEGQTQLIGQAENLFLFAGDFDSTDVLTRRLRAMYGQRAPELHQVAFLIEHLSIEAAVTRKPKASSADAYRAKVAIERIANAPRAPRRNAAPAEQSARDRAYLGESDPRLVIFEGAPGTGKTIELMRLALQHAAQGRRVLFTCFNLVLASFLEGLLAHEDVGEELAAEIDIIPVGRLRVLVRDDSQSMVDLYDTVCIDEAQDLASDAFDNIQLVTTSDARWFLADGPGQEIYSDETPAPLLTRARARAKELNTVVKLTTSRRAATAAAQIARSVRDVAPSSDRIPAWYSTRAIQRRSKQTTLDLEIEPIPDPTELIDLKFWEAPPGKEAAFEAVVSSILGRLHQERRPQDLAILVARTRKDHVNLETVRRVLDRMDVPYLDQTVPENKSMVLPEGHVRLVSYSSARGIEASRVLLLDLGYAFWEAKSVAEAERSRALLYVALTRGRLGTTVLCAPVERERPYVKFLGASVAEYERLMNLEP